LVPLTRNIADDFAPCSAITLRTDDIAVDWWVVPPEIQQWLRRKAAACRAGTLVPLPGGIVTATWAYGLELDETGQQFQWTSDHAQLLVARSMRELPLEVRRTNASDRAPAAVRLASGGWTETVTLTSAKWHPATVTVRATIGSWLRRMHRIDIDVSPVFVPAEVDASNPDRRRLGVQLRWVGVR
jgi:hypothetical protein